MYEDLSKRLVWAFDPTALIERALCASVGPKSGLGKHMACFSSVNTLVQYKFQPGPKRGLVSHMACFSSVAVSTWLKRERVR